MQKISNKKNKKTILLVEDEQDIRLLYAEVLTDAGYQVVQAGDGTAALSMIRQEDWDLLLLDVILPEKDGMEILKDIKGTEYMNKGAIIMLTNLKNEKILKQAFEMGVEDYIVKSDTNPDKLISEVNRVLHKSK